MENSIGQPATQPATASPPAAASQAASHSRPASHSQPASQCSKSALDYIQHQIAPRGAKSTTFGNAFFPFEPIRLFDFQQIGDSTLVFQMILKNQMYLNHSQPASAPNLAWITFGTKLLPEVQNRLLLAMPFSI